MPDVQKTAIWLNTMADHMENNRMKLAMKEAARLIMFQKNTIDQVTKANGTMATKMGEYMDAEQKKLLYIFPCAPGQKVYVITSCVGIMDVNGGEEDFAECPFETSGDCPMHNKGECGEHANTMAVYPDTVDYLMVDKNGEVGIITKRTGGFTSDMIGIELFFDKEQAERKLEEMKYARHYATE